jgi:hypothetical protein
MSGVLEEAHVLGMPWQDRGRRGEEHIALLRHPCCAQGDLVKFGGEFHDLLPVHSDPRPARAAAVRASRNPDELVLVASAASHPETDWPALIAKYAAVGVDHLQIRLTADPLAAMDELEQLAEQEPAE